MKKTLNTNLTVEERANMTAQQVNLRIEDGEDIDYREEVITGDDTFESIFAEVDANRANQFGKHRVHLVPVDRKKDVVPSYKIVKNGVITESKPYIRLKFIDDETGMVLNLSTDREKDSQINYTTRLYAGMVEGLRRNINHEYAGVAETMTTPRLLEFLESHGIDIWTRWDAQYQKVAVDFFDREAWEAYKRECSAVGANTRKSGGTQRPTEKRATR